MTLSPLTWTLLEKAATDNGFDVVGPVVGDWRLFTSSRTGLRIWLSGLGSSLFVAAFSRSDVAETLSGLGIPWKNPLPPGAAAALSTGDLGALHHLLRRAFQVSRALPDEPLHVFRDRTAHLPATTETERLVVQRIGQDVFRAGLVDFWEGRCAVTGLAVVELLRASHIKPWADCDTDAERLDIYNGLLLAPHTDAAFDRGLITVADDGSVTPSPQLDAEARRILGLDTLRRVRRLHDRHRAYLEWHRARVFRAGGAV